VPRIWDLTWVEEGDLAGGFLAEGFVFAAASIAAAAIISK
jgi:hypothetical protein